MNYLGDFRLGDTFDTKFCTVSTTGAPTTLAGTPVVSAYVGNSLTQLTAGITLTVDFDAVTGLHNVRVVATSGNGYATASNYQLVITTGTVGGTSVVGYVIGEFSIEARSAVMPTTAARTLDVSVGGEAGVDWANVGSPTTAVNLSATNIDVDQIVASVTGAVGSIAVAGIASTAFAAGAIDAAALALDAIGAAELATGAVDEIVDAVWNEATAGHTTAATYGDKFGAHLPAVLKAIIGAGSTTTAVVLNATTGIDGAAPSATNDFYKGRVIIFTSGALAGQATDITAYTGATVTLTVTALTAAPADTVTAVIV